MSNKLARTKKEKEYKVGATKVGKHVSDMMQVNALKLSFAVEHNLESGLRRSILVDQDGYALTFNIMPAVRVVSDDDAKRLKEEGKFEDTIKPIDFKRDEGASFFVLGTSTNVEMPEDYHMIVGFISDETMRSMAEQQLEAQKMREQKENDDMEAVTKDEQNSGDDTK